MSVDANCLDDRKEMFDLEEDEAAELAFVALDKGKDVEEYLDYMDSDDVEKLAFAAYELGKSMECYLDYLEEDAIKELLLKAMRK